MSPTDAILMRKVDLSGAGGDGGAVGRGAASGTGAETGAGGTLAHAASCNKAKQKNSRADLVTESNTHDVNLGRAQPAARHIQFIKVVYRSNIDTVIIAIIDLRTLDARFDAVQCEFGPSSVSVDMGRK